MTLQEHIETLQEENRQLREALSADCGRLRVMFGLTGKQADILGALMSRERVSNDMLEAVVWPVWKPDLVTNNIKVHVYNLRRKLPAWVVINTIWGFGYSLDPDVRQRLKDIEDEA